MAYDEKLAERVRAALAGRDDVVEKRMFGGVAFMVRGHMSCGIVGSTLMLRLAPEDADGFLSDPHVRPMDFTGRPMRGFLYVDPDGIKTAVLLRKWIGRATTYAEAQPRKVRSATLGSTSGQLAAIQTKAFAKFYALLTAEQRTKLDELHANGRGLRGPGAELSVGPGLP